MKLLEVIVANTVVGHVAELLFMHSYINSDFLVLFEFVSYINILG